ncbi:MAG: tetratricopeptide repeat protein [Chloroflexi bacterium]|nr:tetratricopeptide repeat protein [Chloroflexota bacterium]
MNEKKSAPKPVSPHELSRGEMKASMVLPVVISVGVMLLGMVVYLLIPDDFNTGLAIALSFCMLAFLLYWTRQETLKLRVTAVLLAIPALVGISYGMSNGRANPIIFGVGVTILLLIGYRLVSTPISYRFAYRRYLSGEYEAALTLVEKTTAARPDFWEAYQLKALIFLELMDFPRAERSAIEATDANPRADIAFNTLGQIHLLQAQFEAAKQAYIHCVELNPDNALYWYHLGLCQYRLAEYDAAVESLAAASKRSPRILEYELLQHYYMWRCLQQLNREELAAEVLTKMQKFTPGLTILQTEIEHQPQTAHLPLMQADLDQLAKIISSD